MSVPDAVKKQEEEAQKLYEDAYKEEERPDEPSEESPAEEVVVAEEPVVEEPVAEEPVAEEEPVVEDDYREKFFTLQGKYDAEVPRLYQEIQALREQMSSIRSAPERLDDEDDDAVDPRERLAEDYGESFVDDLRSLFRAEINDSMAPVTQRLQATETVAIKSGQDRYLVRLTEIVPDWRTVVNDQRFHQFARETDEFSGIPRYTLMQNAESNMDAERMSRFYKEFKRRIGEKPTAGNGAKKAAALTPGQTSTKSNTGKPSEPEYVSAQEIEKFATDVALRKYLGREEEQKKMEEKINKAIVARRVI